MAGDSGTADTDSGSSISEGGTSLDEPVSAGPLLGHHPKRSPETHQLTFRDRTDLEPDLRDSPTWANAVPGGASGGVSNSIEIWTVIGHRIHMRRRYKAPKFPLDEDHLRAE